MAGVGVVGKVATSTLWLNGVVVIGDGVAFQKFVYIPLVSEIGVI